MAIFMSFIRWTGSLRKKRSMEYASDYSLTNIPKNFIMALPFQLLDCRSVGKKDFSLTAFPGGWNRIIRRRKWKTLYENSSLVKSKHNRLL